MKTILGEYLARIWRDKRRRKIAAAVLMVLSVMVAMGVVWQLRLTGETQTEDASLLASPEYQLQIEDTIFLIDCLPEVSQIETTIGQFQTAQDEPGLEAYCAKAYSQVKSAFDMYNGLTQEQQSSVTNAQRLEEYTQILEILKDYANLPDYSASSGQISAGATLAEGAALPEGASFALEELDVTGDAYAQAQEKVTEYLGSHQENQLLSMTVVDMHFSNSMGEHIQANGTTQVTLTFETPIFTGEGAVYALHLAESGVEDVTREVIRDDTGVTAIILETGSFSDFSLVQVASETDEFGDVLDSDVAYLTNLKLCTDTAASPHVSGYEIRTGTAEWDENDDAGNDSSELNQYLRTFDVATYNFTFTTNVRSGTAYSYYVTGELYFEFIIQGDADRVQFETGSMGWLDAKVATYNITEQVVDGVTCQVLQGHYTMQPENGETHAIGATQRRHDLVIRSLAGCNGETISPIITMWLEGNVIGADEAGTGPMDYSAFGTADFTGGVIYGLNTACPNHKMTEYTVEAQSLNCADVENASLIISAAPRYNIALVNGDAAKYQVVGTYDFSDGNDKAFNTSVGSIYGRMAAYGITIQIRGKTGQGLRGVELPASTGNITFELSLKSQFHYTDEDLTSHTVDVTDTYTPQVWTCAQNTHNNSSNETIHDPWGRSLDLFNLRYLANVPFNDIGLFSSSIYDSYNYRSCYDGGYWNMTYDETTGKYTVTIDTYTLNTDYMPPHSKSDGTELTHTYYDPETVNAYWEVDEYVFSAGQLYVVQPINRDIDGVETRVTTEYGEGTFYTTLSDSSLTMTTKSGEEVTVTQPVTTDDNRRQELAVVKPGHYEQVLYYLKGAEDNTFQGWNNALTDGCYSNGKDWAVQGQYITLESHVIAYGESTETPVGFDVLMKFDDQFFEPNTSVANCVYYGNPMGSEYQEGKFKQSYYKYLWAAKPDKTGWDHGDLAPNESGYDTEMINAVPEDLIYFESMSALTKAGYTCVGCLFQYRGLMYETASYPIIGLTGKIKETAQSNMVYMITPYSRIWTRGDLIEASGLSTEAVLEMSFEEIHDLAAKTIPYIRGNYTWSEILAAYQAGTPVYDNYPYATWVNGPINDGDGGMSEHHDRILAYEKAYYDADGTCHDNFGGSHWGDSCLVMGQRTTVTVEPQQSVNGSTKVVYDLDTNQTVVDYSVYPVVVTNLEESTKEKTYTVVVTLPAGLNYLQNSSIYNGTYYDQISDVGGVQGNWKIWGDSHWGSFIDGGVKSGYKPDDETPHTLGLNIYANDDGTTTLVYEITTVLPYTYPIRFSAVIDSDEMENGQQLTVTATATSTEEMYLAINETNENIDTTTISVNKSGATSMYKLADQTVVDAGEGMGFTMHIHNSGDQAMNLLAVDSLPYVGTGSGEDSIGDGVSSFSGSLCVTEFSVTNYADLDMTQYQFYYTANAEMKGKRATDLDYTTFPNESQEWVELELVDGVAQLPDSFEPYLIAVYGTLNAGVTLNMHITLYLPDGTGGDLVQNVLSRGSMVTSAQCGIVSRTLEGKTWIDLNHNGLQEAEETLQSGIKVELVDANDNVVASTTTGSSVNCTTGTQSTTTAGNYRFTNVPKGTYSIRFSSGTFDLSCYYGSPVNAGSSDYVDSDASAYYSQEGNSLGYLQYSLITQVTMPEASSLTYASYTVSNMDAGFYSWGVVLPATGGTGTSPYIVGGLKLMSLSLLIYIVLRRRRRKGAR